MRPTSADICRTNGYEVGTFLAGKASDLTTVIEITAIGVSLILARAVYQDGHPVEGMETNWTLQYRDWHRVEDPR